MRIQPKALQDTPGALASVRKTMDLFKRKQNVLQGSKMRKEIVRLKDHADVASVLAKSLLLKDELAPVEKKHSAVRMLQSGQDSEQGRLSAAGGTHQRHRVIEGSLKVHVSQDLMASEPLLDVLRIYGHRAEGVGLGAERGTS
jgi:hypothetical protein